MKNILVTGDTGFIGSSLFHKISNAGKYNVLGISRNHSSVAPNLINFDITTGKPKIRDVDVIIHLAADVTCKNRATAYKVNVTGTKNILDFAKDASVDKFIYVSTGGVYGFGKKPFKETDTVKPYNTYTRTKHKAELLCEKYASDMSVVVLRYFFPYGPSNGDRLVNRLINSVKFEKEIKINLYGTPRINPIYITDLIEATMKSIRVKSDYEIFNIGGNHTTGIESIVKIIENFIGKKAVIKNTNILSQDMIGDISKARKILKFKPKTTLELGIEKTIKLGR